MYIDQNLIREVLIQTEYLTKNNMEQFIKDEQHFIDIEHYQNSKGDSRWKLTLTSGDMYIFAIVSDDGSFIIEGWTQSMNEPVVEVGNNPELGDYLVQLSKE